MVKHGTEACYRNKCQRPECLEAGRKAARERMQRRRDTKEGRDAFAAYNAAVSELRSRHQEEFLLLVGREREKRGLHP